MILIIDNYDSFTYNLYQGICELVDEVKVIRNDKITIAQVHQLNPRGIILSPGPGRPEHAGICLDLIKEFSGRCPILGICLGMQALASAFGARVINANEIIHGKQSLIFHNRSQLYQGTCLPFTAGRYHSLMVEKQSLPEELQIEAETANEIIMGIRHREHLSYGFQFHPESILSENGAVLLKNFIAQCIGARLC